MGSGVSPEVALRLPRGRTWGAAALRREPARDLFATTLAQLFDRELARWRTYGLEPMIRRWSAAALPSGTALTVHDGNAAPVTGTFAGLEPDGSLLLDLPDGATRAIHAGDVMLADERT